MNRVIKIGLLDSGVSADLTSAISLAQAFVHDEQNQNNICMQEVSVDPIDHGTAIARILLAAAPAMTLINAQVFSQSNTSSPATVAAGLSWLVDNGAVIINMSFGLRQNRTVLQQACAKALAAGVILVAAAPARGPAVYPSAYPGVLRVTGDARCALKEISHLATEQADFGACPRSYAQAKSSGGASFAVAHIVAALAHFLAQGGNIDNASDYLQGIALYHGPERRR